MSPVREYNDGSFYVAAPDDHNKAIHGSLLYIYIYIYIEREREREKMNYIYHILHLPLLLDSSPAYWISWNYLQTAGCDIIILHILTY